MLRVWLSLDGRVIQMFQVLLSLGGRVIQMFCVWLSAPQSLTLYTVISCELCINFHPVQEFLC